MERDWHDFKALYKNISGAREGFERACGTLFKKKYSKESVHSVAVKNGDGGIDIFVGKLGIKPIKIIQCKFFLDSFGGSQKDQIRKSFTTAIQSKDYVAEQWILCIPHVLNLSEHVWWNKWKQKQITTYDKEENFIKLIDGRELIDLMKEYEIYNQIFQIDIAQKINEIHKAISPQNSIRKLKEIEEKIDRLTNIGKINTIKPLCEKLKKIGAINAYNFYEGKRIFFSPITIFDKTCAFYLKKISIDSEYYLKAIILLTLYYQRENEYNSIQRIIIQMEEAEMREPEYYLIQTYDKNKSIEDIYQRFIKQYPIFNETYKNIPEQEKNYKTLNFSIQLNNSKSKSINIRVPEGTVITLDPYIYPKIAFVYFYIAIRLKKEYPQNEIYQTLIKNHFLQEDIGGIISIGAGSMNLNVDVQNLSDCFT